jgi:hypothetical protein
VRKKNRSERKGRRSRDTEGDYRKTSALSRKAADLKAEVCATRLTRRAADLKGEVCATRLTRRAADLKGEVCATRLGK